MAYDDVQEVDCSIPVIFSVVIFTFPWCFWSSSFLLELQTQIVNIYISTLISKYGITHKQLHLYITFLDRKFSPKKKTLKDLLFIFENKTDIIKYEKNSSTLKIIVSQKLVHLGKN